MKRTRESRVYISVVKGEEEDSGEEYIVAIYRFVYTCMKYFWMDTEETDNDDSLREGNLITEGWRCWMYFCIF